MAVEKLFEISRAVCLGSLGGIRSTPFSREGLDLINESH